MTSPATKKKNAPVKPVGTQKRFRALAVAKEVLEYAVECEPPHHHLVELKEALSWITKALAEDAK